MPSLGRMFAGDEELGKKDDDHRPARTTAISQPWSVRRPGQGWRKRRIVYLLCAALFAYLFVQNIPTGLGSNALRGDSRVPSPPRGIRLPQSLSDSKSKRPPRPANPSKAEEHYHDGPIKFYKLAASLHTAARLGGQAASNKNVLFVASSLTSVAELVPLACEMARWERNDVHLAIMGRDEMPISEIKEVNGAVEDCKIYWHDARPDYSRWSSDFRMEVSVTASMEHIQTFIHPQIIIIDDPSREDKFFVEALRTKVMDMENNMIELPKNAAETMMWMTRLDSGALAAWPKTYVDIFIQAPSASTGSLIRLLKSIEDADYFGARRPHLTIELPAQVDQPTWKYLQNFIWPPLDWAGSPHASQVTLRHRIPRRTSSEEEASARLVESFYPVRTDDSSVLLLSPQVELSPLYYHYLFYNLLEYKYSDFNTASTDASKLMGISLHLPSNYPNDTTSLDPPLKTKKKSGEADAQDGKSNSEKSPFLWQTPSSDAVLYFGNKWMEFHSFLSNRVSKPPSASSKIFSISHPAWLEHLQSLMRARGWFLLYPSFPDEDTSLATTHSELYEVPEEFTKGRSHRPHIRSSSQEVIDSDSGLTDDKILPPPPPDKETNLLTSNLVSILSSSGDLPEISNLPLLSFNGHRISFDELETEANTFIKKFRLEAGDCINADGVNPHHDNNADDLFCNLDEIYDYHGASGGTNAPPPGHVPASAFNPFGGPPPEREENENVWDPEAMSEKQIKEAKSSNELASHLNRQDNGPSSSSPSFPSLLLDEEPADLPPPTNEKDQSAETQAEFRAQIDRQAKQRGDKAQSPIKDKKEGKDQKEEEDEREDEKEEEKEKDAGKVEKPLAAAPPVPPPLSSPAPLKAANQPSPEPVEPAPPTHGVFKKEMPKQPIEGDASLAVEGDRSPGW